MVLLHPQQRRRSSKYWQERESKRKNIFKKKDSEKLARFEKCFYICTPQNTESSLRDWRENWKKETKKKVSKIFKFFLRETKRSFSFAPALRDKRKIKKYVRRHIELTAVPMQIGTKE